MRLAKLRTLVRKIDFEGGSTLSGSRYICHLLCCYINTPEATGDSRRFRESYKEAVVRRWTTNRAWPRFSKNSNMKKMASQQFRRCIAWIHYLPPAHNVSCSIRHQEYATPRQETLWLDRVSFCLIYSTALINSSCFAFIPSKTVGMEIILMCLSSYAVRSVFHSAISEHQ